MNTGYNKEELIYSLPDYIAGTLNDKYLILEIERELELNPDFRREHAELLKTFAFLESSSLQNPPESYFNNLPVKINERISQNSLSENFRSKLSLKWKILIPALTLFIIAAMLINPFKNENPIVTNVNTEIENTEGKLTDNNKIERNSEITNNETVKGQIDMKTIQPVQKNQKGVKVIKYYEKEKVSEFTYNEMTETNLMTEITKTADENASEETTDDLLYIGESNTENDEDIEELENDFYELTPEQQKDILAILKES